MSFSFTDDQRAIRDAAREFLEARVTSEVLRAAIAGPSGVDESLWRGVAEELGWLGVALPEEFGGSALGAVELAILMEETGRVLAPIPFFATAGLCAPLIRECGAHLQQAEILPQVAAGKLKLAACLTGASGKPFPQDIPFTLSAQSGHYSLTGTAEFVAHGAAADRFVALARAPGSRDLEGLSVVILPARSDGLTVKTRTSLDLTRPYAQVTCANVTVNRDQILGDPAAQGGAIARALAIAAAMLSAEQLGGSDRVLDMSVDYVKQRVQFGRAVGSFQAIKHMLSDMMILIEGSRSAAYYAACAIDDSPEEIAEAASIARAYCSDAFVRCSSDAIQAHGGIGFTWEHDAHFFFKRARSAATLLGDAAHHREAVARIIGLS